jgi:hypothetical protein
MERLSASVDGSEEVKLVYLRATKEGGLHVTPANITTKFRDSYESYVPEVLYNESKAPGDIIEADGNVIASSYLNISLSPLSAGTESSIKTIESFAMPLETAVALSMSQRTVGQEFSVEVVSDDEPLPPEPDIEILNITHANGLLTINTVEPHKLVAGKCIGIRDVPDPRFNYPALVVANAPNPNQITCTAGPQGNVGNIAAGPITGGFIYFRSRLGYAQDGVSQIFENATATNASLYLRSDAGDSLPSGVPQGNHSVTIATTVAVQPINSIGAYSFQGANEYRFGIKADRVQATHSPVDTLLQSNNTLPRTQVIPSPYKRYKWRVRATNNKSLTVPIAQIVSITKTGPAVARIVLDRPVVLTLADLIVGYGPRDAATNFPALAAATAITAIIDPTTIDVTWGPATSAVSYGGYIAKVNGGNLMSALGAQSNAVQSAAVSTLTDGTRVLTLVGLTNWSLTIGDLFEGVGLRNAVDGASLGIDGAYKVRNSGASPTLELVPIGNTTLPADFAAVNCGGALIRRTTLRLHYTRIFDFKRERVEFSPRSIGDLSDVLSVVLQGGSSTANQGGAWNVGANQGTAAAAGTGGLGAWPVRAVAVRTIDVASAAITSTQTSAAVDVSGTTGAQQFTVDVTAASGTGRRLYPRVQESFDGGATFVTTFDLAPIDNNTDKTQFSPVLPINGSHLRYVRKVVGTSPSFTNSLTRTNRPMEVAQVRRQLVDSVVNLTTTTASTDLLYVEGCSQAQIILTLPAGITTAPTVGLQLCDGDPGVAANWYTVAGATVAGAANSTVASAVISLPRAKFARLVPTAAGSGITNDTYTLMLKAWA